MQIQCELLSVSVLDIIICSLIAIVIQIDNDVRLASALEKRE
jgi:hypothetical protein